MTQKEKLLELLDYFEEQLDSIQGYLKPDELGRTGQVEDWSAKDQLFHCLEWANRRLEMLETVRGGDQWIDPDFGDFSEVNQEIFLIHQNRSWQEAREMIKGTYTRAADYLSQVNAADLQEMIESDGRPCWRIFTDNLVTHPMIHVWDILQKSGRVDQVIEIFGDAFTERVRNLDESPGWQGLVDYNYACVLALSGEGSRAVQRLKNALQTNPELVAWSREDSDLDSLRELPEYQDLYGTE